MSRFLLFANILLAASAVVFANHWRIEKAEAKKRAESLVRVAVVPLKKSPKQSESSPPPKDPRTLGTTAVQQFVFSRDRNPDVVEKVSESTPVPLLPAVYGTLNLQGSSTILLGFNSANQHAFSAGESVGAFRLIRFDSATVTFEWKGQEITRSIQDLASKQEPVSVREPVQPILASMPASPQSAKANTDSPQMGPALGESEHACIAGDQQPSGTVTAEGFRKVVTKMPFGEVCRWVK